MGTGKKGNNGIKARLETGIKALKGNHQHVWAQGKP